MTIGPVAASLSPSMDIQVASNFERLLFELKGRNGAAVAADLRAFRDSGALPGDEQGWRSARQLFAAQRVDDTMTLNTIAETYRLSGALIDPHTAVAVAAARAEMNEETTTPMIALATAHPAKFPDPVERATGIRPPTPPQLADIMERRERVTVLPNDIAAVRAFLRTHAQRARPKRGAA
jgi:threonine synthase